MSLNFLRWNRIIKCVSNPNRICQRHFSALTKCCHGENVVLSRIAIDPDCIVSHNRRDFIGWVGDKKDGYRTQKEESDREHIKFGFKQLKTEIKLWTEEVKEHLRADPMAFVPPGILLLNISMYFFE